MSYVALIIQISASDNTILFYFFSDVKESMMERSILHCDMNNCFASIEAKLDPSLRNKAIAVCGSEKERHGIVLAKSQEAKVLGVKTGEAIWEARLKCPHLLVVPPHYDEYLKYSKWAKSIYYEYTNQVEPFGLDEAWLDVTGSYMLHGPANEIADVLRQRIKTELGITISVGVSFNKTFAKLGSDFKKPDAVTEIKRDDFKSKVWPLEVDEMIGIGRVTKKKLNRINIYSLGDLAKSDPKVLKRLLGINGVYLWDMANGNDNSPVCDIDYVFPAKSIGQGITCTKDLVNDEEVKHVLQMLALKVTKRMIEAGLKCQGIVVSVRDCDLKTVSFQSKLSYPTISSIVMVERAMDLFKLNYRWHKTVRSVRIKAIYLEDDDKDIQLDFFEDYSSIKRKEDLDKTIYDIRKKFGNESITFCGLATDIKVPKHINEVITLPNMSKR